MVSAGSSAVGGNGSRRDVPRGSWSFSGWCREWSRPILLPVARFFARLGMGPNVVSLLGLAAYGACGLVLALGYRAEAGWMLAVFGPLDAVDGLLARETGRVSTFGAFLDSTMDRFAEFFLFLGLMVYLFGIKDAGVGDACLVLSALAGSFLVSYTRARAEALGYHCKVGLLTRFERLLVFAVGLIFDLVYPALWIIAVFANLTAIQRVFHVFGQARR